MEIQFITQKNNVKLDTCRSYPLAFHGLCEQIEKEHPSLRYIKKSSLSKEEHKEVKEYYLNDGIYDQEVKVFGFGSFSYQAGKDSYTIESN